MGLFTPPAPVALAPVNPAVAVFTSFVAQGPVTLVLREKVFSLSGDDFSVKDAATGRTVVKCKGKVVSFRDRKSEYCTSLADDPDGDIVESSN